MKKLYSTHIIPLFYFALFIFSSSSVRAQQLDCSTPSDCSILVTNESGSTTYADTYFGPYSVNRQYTGETFWFCISPIFVYQGLVYYWPSSDWGTCQENGTASFWASPSSNVNIAPWDYAYADITFTSSGNWTIYSSYPGWTCQNSQCGSSSVPGCNDQIAVNLTSGATPTPTPTFTPTPTPTPHCESIVTTRPLMAYKHPNTYIVSSTINGWCATGNTKIQIWDGYNPDNYYIDYIACAQFVPYDTDGTVDVLGSQYDGLDECDNFSEVEACWALLAGQNLPDGVRKCMVVSSIYGGIIGYAIPNSTRFIISTECDSTTMAHEYGHCLGLMHVSTADSWRDYLMYYTAGADRKFLAPGQPSWLE